MRENFSIRSLLGFGWENVKRHFTFFLGLMVILGLIVAILLSLQYQVGGRDAQARMGLWLFNILAQTWISLGCLRIALAFCDGRMPHITELFIEFRHLPQVILGHLVIELIMYLYIALAGALIFLAAGVHLPSFDAVMNQQYDWKTAWTSQGLAVQVAAVAAILIPLAFLKIRLYFFPYFVVDQDAGPLEALGRSWDATRGVTLRLCWLWIVLVALNILGGLLFLAGLIFTIPISMLVLAAAYRTLAARQMIEEKQEDEAGE